ncbi:MAG: hypothetical protein EOP69_00580 [Spirochaetia bacterium]|nr:MAG: hypothetical protein EOP69_00580 [Spirochaetia bacterium]
MPAEDPLSGGSSGSFAPEEARYPAHVSNPGDHCGPYSALADDAVQAAYERVAADPDDQTSPLLLAELVARGIATS